MTAYPIDRAFDDPQLLGAALGDPKPWRTWRTVLKAAFGLALNRTEAKAFAQVAGSRKPPRQRVAELWAIAGRRGGKSRMAALVATYIAAFIDHRGRLAPGERGYVAVLSPTMKQAGEVKSYIEGFFASSPILAQMLDGDPTADEIRLHGGIVISVHPANFRSIRGRTLLACILDEVAFFRDETSTNPDIEVYRAVLPALGTTDGLLIGISSPYRKVGLLHTKYRDHYGQDGDVLVIQAPTTVLNPTYDTRKIDAARKNDPEAATSEYDAMFRAGISSLLDDAAIDAAIDYGRPLELPYRREFSYVAFTDASAGRHDQFTLCIGHREDERFVADVIRGAKPPFDPNAVAKEYAQIARAYGCRKIVGDNFAGEWTVQAFKAADIEYVRSRKPRSQLYLEAVPHFMRGAISIPDLPQLIRELRLLERRVAPSGKDRVDHGQGGSDDYANALVGALSVDVAPKASLRVGMLSGLGEGYVTWLDPDRPKLNIQHVARDRGPGVPDDRVFSPSPRVAGLI